MRDSQIVAQTIFQPRRESLNGVPSRGTCWRAVRLLRGWLGNGLGRGGCLLIILIIGGSGCLGAKSTDKPKMTSIPGLEADATPRAQNPVNLGGPLPAPELPQAPPPQAADTGTLAIKVIARVGSIPIYDHEVREAVNQRLPEFMRLEGSDRQEKERTIYREELRRIIDRELVLSEVESRLKENRPQMLAELKSKSQEIADKTMNERKKQFGLKSDDELRNVLSQMGLTVEGIKRHLSRRWMFDQFIQSQIVPKTEGISLAEIQDYYVKNPADFQAVDAVKWQDIFISVDHKDSTGKPSFEDRRQAKAFAEDLVKRARRGDDFLELVRQYDHGDSSFRKGMGAGEKRGEIQPKELEPVLFKMTPNTITMVEMPTGFHIIKLLERTNAGLRPFDAKTQQEIRRKLQDRIFEQEYMKMIDGFKRRIPIVVADEVWQ